MPADITVRQRLGQQIKDSEAFRARSLPLAVLASVVCTVLASAFGTDRVGTLLSAATGPLISALFTTQGRGKARGVGITLVTLVAVALTFTGFTVPELIVGGKALIADRHGTFVPAEGGGSSSSSSTSSSPLPPPTRPAGPAITTSSSSLTCPDTAVSLDASTSTPGTCPPVEVRNVGTAELQITGLELTGTSASEFRVTTPCTGALAAGASCRIALAFRPAGTGERQAVLLIHQNLPSPANRVELRGTGLPLSTDPPASPAPVQSDPVAVSSP